MYILAYQIWETAASCTQVERFLGLEPLMQRGKRRGTKFPTEPRIGKAHG